MPGLGWVMCRRRAGSWAQRWRNLQGQQLGRVENLMVDLSAGRIIAVIISTGEFLGLGGELSAVPPTALRFNPQHDTLQLDVSKETLANSPHFKAGQWPDFSQPGYAGGVYHACQVEPWFNPDATTCADNPGQVFAIAMATRWPRSLRRTTGPT